MTLLAPETGLAAKRVSVDGVQSAPPSTWHRAVEYPIATFGDLCHALTTLSGQSEWFLVRGRVRPGLDMARIRRSHVGAEGTLLPASHQWILIDLDSVMPEVTDFASRPAHYAARVRSELLPAAFTNAACFWQATGSAGVKPGVRLRMAFWLTRPLSDAEARQWVSCWPVAVDKHLYTPSQPHYTAAPVFDGVADPVGARTGTLPGDESVVPPEVTAGSEAYSALDKATNAVARRPEGQRRTALNAAAYRLARQFSEDALPAETIFAALDGAAGQTGLPGAEAQLTLRYAIRDGRSAHAKEHAGWRDGLVRDKDDSPKNTLANVALTLQEHEAFKSRIGLNVRDWSVVWVRSPEWEHRERGTVIDTAEIVRIVQWFQASMGMDIREGWVKSALTRAACEAEYDPVRDYLDQLPAWDGSRRAETFFVRHLGAVDTPLTRACTLMWLTQAVRRAYATVTEPIKADYVLTMIGPQGIGKSTVLERMCVQGMYRTGLPRVGGKDAQQALGSAWIVELAEFTQRAADANTFKAFVTTSVDKYRPPYGAVEVTIPRRCVLAVTTNDRDPLVDRTGNRRFLPIECRSHADFGAVTDERDQVWAETLHYVRAGLRPTLAPELCAELADTQADRLEENPLVSLFDSDRVRFAPGCDWEPGQTEGDRLHWLRTNQACSIAGLRSDVGSGLTRVRNALEEAGWTEIRTRENGVRRRKWIPPKTTRDISKEAN